VCASAFFDHTQSGHDLELRPFDLKARSVHTWPQVCQSCNLVKFLQAVYEISCSRTFGTYKQKNNPKTTSPALNGDTDIKTINPLKAELSNVTLCHPGLTYTFNF